MSGSLHIKTCGRCGIAKPLHDFYAQPTSKDGLQSACKECVKTGMRAARARNRNHYVLYDNQREQTQERKADKAEARKRHRALHPDKARARNAVNNAIRDGRLTRQPCEHCGSTQNVHAHHHDYSKPLDIEWLCKDCHWKHHNEMKEAV